MDQELTLQDANYLNKEDKRTLALSSLGGALEFYDFVIYVFYAKIINDKDKLDASCLVFP